MFKFVSLKQILKYEYFQVEYSDSCEDESDPEMLKANHR